MKRKIISAWDHIESLGWKRNKYDYRKIAKDLFTQFNNRERINLRNFVNAKVAELYAAIEKYEKTNRKLAIGGGGGSADVLHHIVGLGQKEFRRCMADPVLIEKRYNAEYGSDEGYKESFAYCFHEPDLEPPHVATKDPNLKIVRCIVAAINANGESDFFFCKVECTQEQYDNGYHYDAAKEQAENEGYEAFLAYDENDSALRAILGHFQWETASVIKI